MTELWEITWRIGLILVAFLILFGIAFWAANQAEKHDQHPYREETHQ